jgi:hypothetical protein
MSRGGWLRCPNGHWWLEGNMVLRDPCSKCGRPLRRPTSAQVAKELADMDHAFKVAQQFRR